MKGAHTIALAAALAIAAGVSACGGSGAVVANVGGNPIGERTLNHWISVAGGAAVDRGLPAYKVLQGQVLDFLISAQWTFGEAGELGVTADDRQAQTQLELLAYDGREGLPYEGLPRHGELPALLASARDHADRLWLMKLAILTLRVQQRHLAQVERQIQPGEVLSYYDQHKAAFVVPERRDIEWVVVYSESLLQRAMREIRAGQDFVSVAQRVSLDPPTITGMELASYPEKAFVKNVFAAKPHVITGPFRQVQNHYELEVTKVTPARLRTLAESEASIRQRLAASWASTTLPGKLERKWAARTTCRPGYVVPVCGRSSGASA
jgi:hypothetical protein